MRCKTASQTESSEMGNRGAASAAMGETEMILDFTAAVLYIGIVWILGQWTAGRLRREDLRRGGCLLSFALGFSELTLASTFLYFTCRLPVQAIRVLWLLAGAAAFADLCRRRELHGRVLAVPAAVTLLWLIMLLPGLLGRDQYYVYRGHCTDQQTYVEETVAMSMHPIGWYEERSEEEISLVSDVLWRGYRWAVQDRPSAGLMIAVMRSNPAGEIYWVVYLYRMFVLAMVMPSLLYLFHVVIDGKTEKGGRRIRYIIWPAAAALYCVGFWGQIQYDIDAVSQISALAVLTALSAEFLRDIRATAQGESGSKGRYFAMILLASAGLALYLESALVHGALYLVTGAAFLVRSRQRLSGKQTLRLASVPAAALAVLIAANYRITGFLLGQINSSVSDGRQAWANYFNTWWLGRHGIDDGRITGPVSRLINCIVSMAGMYNMTVNYERYYGLTAIAMTGFTALLALLILFCLLRPLIVRKTEEPAWLLGAMMMAGIVIVFGMCVFEKYWSAGKLLYYISPYLYAFLCLPALQVRNCRGIAEKAALVLAFLLLISNLGMVYSKCKDVRVNTACLGYRGTYPSDMIAGLKMTTDFTFDTRLLDGIDGVVIQDLSEVSDSQFYLQYLKVKLTCAGIPWRAENDVNYYRSPLDISQRRELTGNVATLEAVKNAEDRWEIAVKR